MNTRLLAITKMKSWLADGTWPVNTKVPAERDLAERLGISRGVLRLALGDLEAEGYIWRHVGKGTFVGAQPDGVSEDLAQLANRTSPMEVMSARLAMEPGAARLAALHATPPQITQMHHCLERTRLAKTFQEYAFWDGRLHVAIAQGTRNALLTHFLETLHGVRHLALWGRLREKEPPVPTNPSLIEHDKIVLAIENRQPEEAARAMLEHLQHVEQSMTRHWHRD